MCIRDRPIAKERADCGIGGLRIGARELAISRLWTPSGLKPRSHWQNRNLCETRRGMHPREPRGTTPRPFLGPCSS
eukprot:2550502-Alexandrium_andersonii.AAC.1